MWSSSYTARQLTAKPAPGTRRRNSRPTVSFTYGVVVRQHGRFASFPGSCNLPVTVPCRSSPAMAPLHEFCHAASDFNNGKVNDLYNDIAGGFLVNKKARAKPPTRKLLLYL
jgi:hypothetical protein